MQKLKSVKQQIIKGRRMEDGSSIEGVVIGRTPFLYVISTEEITKALSLLNMHNSIEIKVKAERILDYAFEENLNEQKK